MDKFQAMQVFVAVVERASFTRAAEHLQLPRASVTLSIQQLETHLGTRLLQRTTRQVNTTADGDAYYQRCVRLLADLEETESAFSHSLLNPRGKLKLNLQGSLGTAFVIPALPGFSARYPLIELEIGMGDRLVDLVREGIDCVLRGGELRDSSMIARRVALMTQITCASSSYLEKHGLPKTLADLEQHQAVNYFSSVTGRNVDFEFVVDGKKQLLPMKGMLSVNDADAYAASAAAGYGLIQLPRYHVAAQLAAGSMCEVLPGMRPPAMPVSILYPRHRQLSPRVRVFADWLTELMAGNARLFE
ncbi:LysR family transcriptional regulator [Undibacterium sp. TS12]|uniref:LysR family transcriptional regulator n=1 Tax=Undibacterium sp. TS12 TaxID=2908202 RepID=UPI001F4D1FCB|nr:LysR family transcriptional regulator [Undibacterium sp. TS12]MCH8619284.1 LysR family transcriptional regulator [Undibacterium sp. TS12]